MKTIFLLFSNNDDNDDSIEGDETTSDVSEYIDFYQTNIPFTYRMELITARLFSTIDCLRDYLLKIMQGIYIVTFIRATKSLDVTF